ncbi:MAG: glycerophosphodiester phosphodiesterase family protein [Bacteroidota bacterium]
MQKIVAIFFLLIFLSCKKDPATFELNNLNNGEIGCFGHAGMGFYSNYPVNSWPGFESCLNRGADGTEMDIQVTKDSVLVILHDEYLQQSTSCSGTVKELNWADINNCNIPSKFFKDSKLMSFDEFIKKVPNPKNHIYTWDCKLRVFGDDAYNKLYARAIVNTINKYDLTDNVFIENPFDDFLQNIKDLKPDAHLFVLADDFDEGLKKVKQHAFYGLSMHTNKVTARQVTTAHDSAVYVTIYGVLSEKENYGAIEKCPDFIQTDNINYLLKVFSKYNRGKGFLYDVTK